MPPPPPGGAPPPPPGSMPPGMMFPGMMPPGMLPPGGAAGLLSVPKMPVASAPPATAAASTGAPPPPSGAPGAVPPPPTSRPAAAPPSADAEDERPAKRIRTDGFQDEAEWIAENPMEFSLAVQCPVLEGKYGGAISGQVLSIEVQLTDKVSTLKAKIQAACGIPPGKQTLKIGASTLNNINSLAFYNVSAGKQVVMTEKTRGGKKK
mmetsp:Transcript_29455/g.77203  ORF Transcript_29455/g.77203 Transcript_29455/m.77203 type:complete len:207 (-) Transcript_29455:1307-1927(-)